MKEVKVTLSKDWEITNSVRIPGGTEVFVSPLKETQLEKKGVIENRKRTIKGKENGQYREVEGKKV